MRRNGPVFRPLVARGRRTVIAILVLFAILSSVSVILSTRAAGRSKDRAAVVQIAARQRMLAQRYVNDVLLTRAGAAVDASYTAGILRKSANALLEGGLAPDVHGDDDETLLPAATEPVIRKQLKQESRLVEDLIATGNALLEGRSVLSVPPSAGQEIAAVDPVERLRIVAALTENVSLNAARTMAASTDRNVAELMGLQVTLGVVTLVAALLLGWALMAATRRQTAHFASLVTASTDLVLVFGHGGCRYSSPPVASMVGRGDEDLLGTGYAEFVHPDDLPLMESVCVNGEPGEFVFRMSNRFGEWRHLQACVTDLRDDRQIRGVVLNSRDITDRVRLEAELSHRAFHDELTGLANRALFRDRLDHALARSERSREAVIVLMIDLDWFKQVNDSMGHDAGDQLLEALAARFDALMRPSDTMARLGGDEFAVLLEGSTQREGVAVADRLLDELRTVPVMLNDREIVVGASIGIAVHPGGAGESDELVRRADVAMYAAKEAGRGRCEVFRPEMVRDSGELLGLENDLRRGLLDGEVTVHYQPSYNIDRREIVGVEALVRWHSPTRGQVPPSLFIPVAEACGLIHELGEFVLLEAASQTARWSEAGLLPEEFTTWVNLSAVQLSDSRIANTVRRTLESVGLEPSRLGVEVTETAIVVDGASAERARELLQDLHEQGIGIALDDFGTGFSSLGHLRSFPIDVIKIDLSFIQGIEHNAKDAAIAANLVSLAHSLSLVAVAEGIETEGQHQQLSDIGCDLGQGYLLARPTPPDVVAELLATQRELTATKS